MNLLSPIAGVSYKVFILGTFMGLIPFNIIHVSTGVTLNSVSTFGLQHYHFFYLFGLGIVSLFPVALLRAYKLIYEKGGTKLTETI